MTAQNNCRTSLILTSLASIRWVIGAVQLWIVAVSPVEGQPALDIELSSVRVEPGLSVTFRFQGAGQDANAFLIETTSDAVLRDSWKENSTAKIEILDSGLFQATVAVQGARLFCRVRALDVGASSPVVLINEVMSDNVSAFAPMDGDFWDWIELYNPNDEAVNLERYALTDDETVPDKWRFPAVFIQPHAYLLIYASDLNRTNAEAALHANFKLKASGESLVLNDASLRPLDRLLIPGLAPDQSVGRAPDGGAKLQFYDRTGISPGKANLVNGAGPALPAPTFLPDGGFFDGPLTVEIHGAETGQSIYYTLDGSAPTVLSPRFTSGLTLTASSVLRAVIVGSQGEMSAPESRTYFVGVRHALPIVSIATDPGYLSFRDGYLYGMGPKVLSSQNQVLQNYPYTGSNAWQDREVEIAVEFFETNRTVGFRQRAGMKIFGGWGSRGYPQKSLALFARRTYGAAKFDYRLFPDQSVDQFEAFVLRNSGNDNQGTHQTPPRPPITEFGPTTTYGSYFVNGNFTLMRDALLQRLIQETGLDTQAYRPAVVYVNGEYWGLYNLREKMNEDYVLSHHNLPSGGVDLIEGYGTVNAGTASVYTQMRQFFSTKSMAESTNYAFVAETYLDIDNFIGYHLAVIYFQNFDIGNIKCWRPRAARGQFRWMIFDQDYGFNLWPPSIYLPAMARDYADYDNMFQFYTAGTGTRVAWPNGGGNTLLLRSLLNHPEFKERFIRRCADLLNTSWREDRVEMLIGEMAAVIRPEIASHLNRWSWTELTRRGFGKPHQAEYQPFTQATWETNLTVLSDFGRQRPARLRQDCLEHFQLKRGLGTLHLEVKPEGAARLRLNSLTIDSLPWQGIYFVDITNQLQVIPKPGYRFAEWITPTGSDTNQVLAFGVQPNTTTTVTAQLEVAPAAPPSPSELVITEIQYHPSADQDCGDWIELHHIGTAPLNLAGWVFRDGDDDHAFLLPDTVLPPDGWLVLCQDAARFRLYYPATVPVAGSFKFGLGNGGGALRLFRPDGTVAQHITYDDEPPWPSAADGGGATLQLADPNSDPNLPASWKASSTVGGSPGRW